MRADPNRLALAGVSASVFVLLSLKLCAGSLDQWHTRISATTQDLYGVAWGDGHFVAVGAGGTVQVSSNGVAWNKVSSAITNDFFDVTFANGRFVAVGTAGTILTSSDAAKWTASNPVTTNQLNAVAFGGGLFVAVGQAGTILSSPDATDWTVQSSGTANHLTGVASGGGSFVAVGRGFSSPGTLLTSSNALAWVDRSAPNLGVGFYTATYGNGTFLAVDARGVVYASPDGLLWKPGVSAAGGTYLFGAACGQDVFVAVGGEYSATTRKIVSSANTTNWTTRLTNAAPQLRRVAYGNGYFVAVGKAGLTLQSDPIVSLKVGAVAAGTCQVTLSGEVGRIYTIASTTNPVAGPWTELLRLTNAAETTQFTDPAAPSRPAQFYRATSAP